MNTVLDIVVVLSLRNIYIASFGYSFVIKSSLRRRLGKNPRELFHQFYENVLHLVSVLDVVLLYDHLLGEEAAALGSDRRVRQAKYDRRLVR